MLEESEMGWHLDKIDITGVWEITTGSPDIIVAVIDFGVDFSHPELSDAQWINEDEMKEKIFLKSFSTSNEKFAGMGLYLAGITMEKYGGKITVDDNKPNGTVFTLTLQKTEESQ